MDGVYLQEPVPLEKEFFDSTQQLRQPLLVLSLMSVDQCRVPLSSVLLD
jgi:hypothetical protein